jgi:alpha-L-fucosidase
MLRGSVAAVLCAILTLASVARSADVDRAKRTEELKQLKFGMFVCWSLSTFSDREWTPGVQNLSFFNPAGCDTDQWASVAKEAGMGYVLFLTKHHDGFCLWDTATTQRKVTRSPLAKDVLAAVRKSCDKYGLKLALYYSEGDWTWPGAVEGKGNWPGAKEGVDYAGGKNPEMKKAQLKELLTQYGPIEFFWFDHAVGDGGWDHEATARFIKGLQPGCFVGFNHGQPAGDLRLGECGRPALIDDPSGAGVGRKEKGMADYKGYLVAEFTMPILTGPKDARWFYTNPENDNKVMPAGAIVDFYRNAVRVGNIFSLDVAPDRTGRLREIDVKTLREVGKGIRELSAGR